MDLIYIREESTLGRFLYWPWLVFTDCGRSFWPLLLWLSLICFVFGAAYADYGLHACLSWLSQSFRNFLVKIDPHIEFRQDSATWFSPYYFSVVTLTTLGFGDITPQNSAGKAFVTTEVLPGYAIMGLLISILANKVARRS